MMTMVSLCCIKHDVVAPILAIDVGGVADCVAYKCDPLSHTPDRETC